MDEPSQSRAPRTTKRRTAVSKRTRELARSLRRAKFDKDDALLEYLSVLRKFSETSALPNFKYLLPGLLSLNGKPYHLQDHFPFEPFFAVHMPKKVVAKTGRQLSKSTSLAASSVLLANMIPHYKTMILTPLFEQVRRFSGNYVRPFIDESPARALWSNAKTNNSVLQRSFVNNSLLIFTFTGLDPSRCRGIAADCLLLDEVQDINADHLPIVHESLSHSKWGIEKFTGTPKTTDNTLHGLFENSSQGEWCIPCDHCTTGGKPTWNIPSAEFHLLKMIGPYRDDITRDRPGTICYNCRQPIRPHAGRWVHRFPERRYDCAGYHVPQIILPLHYGNPKKWAELLGKMNSFAMSQAKFYNEVLGESYDVGAKLITLPDLMNAAVLPWKNNPRFPGERAQAAMKKYRVKVLAIDWGGGGEEKTSFTTLALLGLRSDGRVDVIWGRRLYTPNDHIREALEVIGYVRLFKPNLITHDYTGAGALRETIMVQAGIKHDRILGMHYVGPATHGIIRYVPKDVDHPRGFYRVDKNRILQTTTQAIRVGLVRFFKYDYRNDDDPGLLRDFLALVEEKLESRAGDIHVIRKVKNLIDDFAQAVAIGCTAIWHTQQAWPDFTKAMTRYALTKQMARAIDPSAPRDDVMGAILGVP